MQSVPVGRGRGYMSRDKARMDAAAQPLRRSLIAPVEKEWQSTLDILAMKVAALDISNDIQLAEVKDEVLAYCQTSDRMKILVDDIHERSLNDCKFGVRAAVILAALSNLVVDELKLRAELIKNLQTDFTNADSLRLGKKMLYLNAIAFLGEVYNRVRLANNMPIHVLGAAHLAYQKSLLSGDQTELELCVTLLALNGRKLLANEPTVLNDFMLAVNNVLITNPDERSRAWLLLAIHLHALEYNSEVFPIDLYELLGQHLGADTMAAVLKQLWMSPEFTERNIDDGSSVRSLGSGSDSIKLVTEATVANDGGGDQARTPVANVYRPEAPAPSQRTLTSPDSSNWREKLPAGERSHRHGGGGNRRRGGNDPRSNPETWLPMPDRTVADIEAWGLNPQRGNHWGHDDRCDTDVPRARDWKARGENARYGSGRISKDLMDKPLPDVDSTWD